MRRSYVDVLICFNKREGQACTFAVLNFYSGGHCGHINRKQNKLQASVQHIN